VILSDHRFLSNTPLTFQLYRAFLAALNIGIEILGSTTRITVSRDSALLCPWSMPLSSSANERGIVFSIPCSYRPRLPPEDEGWKIQPREL